MNQTLTTFTVPFVVLNVDRFAILTPLKTLDPLYNPLLVDTFVADDMIYDPPPPA